MKEVTREALCLSLFMFFCGCIYGNLNGPMMQDVELEPETSENNEPTNIDSGRRNNDTGRTDAAANVGTDVGMSDGGLTDASTGAMDAGDGGSADATGQDGAVADGNLADRVDVATQSDASSDAETMKPGWSADFATDNGMWMTQIGQDRGGVRFGVADSRASDNATAWVLFPGDPAAMPNDRTGTRYTTALGTNFFNGFGTYRARVQFPSAAPGEGVIANVHLLCQLGEDTNGNGIPDVTYIGFQIPAGASNLIQMYNWVDYDAVASKVVGWSRTVDTSTGTYSEPINDHVSQETPLGTNPDFRISGFPAVNTYYELGIQWLPTQVRFFLVAGGREVTLWDFRDLRYIPTTPASFVFALRHESGWVNWTRPTASRDVTNADYPSTDMVLRVDWARFVPAMP